MARATTKPTPADEPAIESTVDPAATPAPEPVTDPAAAPAVDATPEPAVDPAAAPAVDAAPEPAVEAAPKPADEPGVELVEVVMLVTISGLRDGEPWPASGERLALPADEAAIYVANGYAALPAE